MVKRFFVILITILLLAPPVLASADVVIGNEFEWEHQDELIRLERSLFVINGPDGYVIAREEPGSTKDTIKSDWDGFEVTVSLDNGTLVYMDSVYVLKGEYWGVMQTGHHVYIPGWILMDDLLMYYDYKDFAEQYKGELYEFTGSIDKLQKVDEFCLWQWPGSDRARILYVVDEYSDLDDKAAIRTGQAYMDDNDREWVYITIWDGFTSGFSRGGSAQGWICLDDLANDGDIQAFNPAPGPTKWSPDGSVDWSFGNESTSTTSPPSESPTPIPGEDPPPSAVPPNRTFIDTLYNTIFLIIFIASVIGLAAAVIMIILILIKRKKSKKT